MNSYIIDFVADWIKWKEEAVFFRLIGACISGSFLQLNVTLKSTISVGLSIPYPIGLNDLIKILRKRSHFLFEHFEGI